ncbi:MAG: aldo/keto reductase, partial [Oscillospiraceae bacterium]
CCEKPEDMQKIFDEQLSRLKTDYIDFYLLHSLDENNFKKCLEFGAYDFLQKKKEEGKIRHIGFSFHDSPEVLDDICKTYKWDFTQIQLNYLDVTLQRAKEQYDILLKYNIPCFVMEPVRGGALANFAPEVNEIFKSANPDVSIASWAIRFAASLDNVYIVLSGMGDVLQVEDNIKTFSPLKKLVESEYKTIEDAIALYKKLNQIPCTGCRYCMDCAYGVDIPKVFKMFNQFKNTESIHDLKLSVHENINSLPDKCTNCKKCMEHCPQHILIPEELSKINEFIKSRNLLD